jgi:hypothetical protein
MRQGANRSVDATARAGFGGTPCAHGDDDALNVLSLDRQFHSDEI